jgi:chemotaxis protein MotB
MARDNNKPKRQIVIRRVKPAFQRIQHNGAWKVAYADFTTAMMAFFMLLWLLTVSDKVTLQGLADYFTPSNATMSSSSGSGSILAGTAAERVGAKSQGSITASSNAVSNKAAHKPTSDQQTSGQDQNGSAWQSAMPARPDAKMLKAEDDIKTSIQLSPDLNQYLDQLIFEQTADGLRIQLMDTEARPMFTSGSPTLRPYATAILRQIGKSVAALPNRLSIIGHTDGIGGNAPYSNWELSADRANAARRSLQAASVSSDRIAEVVGRAATDPIYPDQPNRPENRRITIIILREAPIVDPDFGAR